MGQGWRRYLHVTLAILCVFPLIVRADSGPKSAIIVIVENPPAGEYYLDLLVDRDAPNENNIHKDDRVNYDPIKLGILESYDEDGWYPVLAHGNGPRPAYGQLAGKMKDGQMHHKFGGGVPERFKVVIVTPDNQVKVSEETRKRVFQETFTLDYRSMMIERNSRLIMAYLKQFLSTLLLTLVIEGIVLLFFDFSLKKNWLVFLGVNFVTQVILTAVLGTALIRFGSASPLLFLRLEAGIIVAEGIAFRYLLKEHSPGWRVGYAIFANLASIFTGLGVHFWNM